MGKIIISEAAKILGVSKKTLMRWDESGKFVPKSRESPLGIRVYDESEIKDLKALLEFRRRFRKNLVQLCITQEAVGLYRCSVWESKRQEELKKQEKELREERDKLFEEFEELKRRRPRIQQLYKQFFMKEK